MRDFDPFDCRCLHGGWFRDGDAVGGDFGNRLSLELMIGAWPSLHREACFQQTPPSCLGVVGSTDSFNLLLLLSVLRWSLRSAQRHLFIMEFIEDDSSCSSMSPKLHVDQSVGQTHEFPLCCYDGEGGTIDDD